MASGPNSRIQIPVSSAELTLLGLPGFFVYELFDSRKSIYHAVRHGRDPTRAVPPTIRGPRTRDDDDVVRVEPPDTEQEGKKDKEWTSVLRLWRLLDHGLFCRSIGWPYLLRTHHEMGGDGREGRTRILGV